LLGEADASVNLVAGEDCDSDEDEEWWVNTVRVEEEGEDLEERENSELEESGREVDEYCMSICMRKDISGLEDELQYFRDAPIPSVSDERKEDRWWSLGPQGSSSGEENEEEVRYLVNLLGGEPKEGGNDEGVTPPQGGAAVGTSR
jgi:hypothetical protein